MASASDNCYPSSNKPTSRRRALHDLDAEIVQREALGLDVTEQRAQIAEMSFEAQIAGVDEGGGTVVRETAVEGAMDTNDLESNLAGLDAIFPSPT